MAFQMNIFWALLLLITGLILLWKSADILVSGAVSVAQKLGVSSLVIGLTVVAMGTSAPEVAASIASAARGAGNVALGNVYGSNVANLALVGGMSALIAPIAVQFTMFKYEMPVLLLSALALWPVLRTGTITRTNSIVLLAVFFTLLILAIYKAKKDARKTPKIISEVTHDVQKDITNPLKTFKMSILLIVLGLAGLAFGADITVKSAVFLGAKAGLSEAVIGLTIVAVGTSLPELVTSFVAAAKGHSDISIGNLVGSNIFNTLLVTGIAGTVRPFRVAPALMSVDYWIMVGVSLLFVLLARKGRKLDRIDGAILFAIYIAYIVFLFAVRRSA